MRRASRCSPSEAAAGTVFAFSPGRAWETNTHASRGAGTACRSSCEIGGSSSTPAASKTDQIITVNKRATLFAGIMKAGRSGAKIPYQDRRHQRRRTQPTSRPHSKSSPPVIKTGSAARARRPFLPLKRETLLQSRRKTLRPHFIIPSQTVQINCVQSAKRESHSGQERIEPEEAECYEEALKPETVRRVSSVGRATAL